MSERGFFFVYLKSECKRIACGYRLVFAELGRGRVRLLDPFTLDAGALDRRTFEKRAQPAKVGKGLIRRAIRRGLETRKRTALVKACLDHLKAPSAKAAT